MATKTSSKKVSSAEEIKLLKMRLKKLENKLKDLERKIDHVYDLDDNPKPNDQLHKSSHP